jgi:hypothetical protein
MVVSRKNGVGSWAVAPPAPDNHSFFPVSNYQRRCLPFAPPGLFYLLNYEWHKMPLNVSLSLPHLLFVDSLIKINYLYISKSIHVPAGTQETSASPYQRPICSKAEVSLMKTEKWCWNGICLLVWSGHSLAWLCHNAPSLKPAMLAFNR